MALSRLKELEADMKKCFRCSLCKMAPLPTVVDPKFGDGCPCSNLYHFHGYSGSGKSIMALSLVNGRIKVDRTLADITFACTACGLCDVSCKFIMEAERHAINMALREHIVEEGFAMAAHRPMIADLQEFGNPAGRMEDPALGWAKELGIKIMSQQRAPVLLFTGCMRCSDPRTDEVARRSALLLRKAGVDFGIMPEGASCCGLPAYWTGHRDAFTKAANELVTRFDGMGVETVVAVSGSCLGAIRSKYPEYARAPKAKVLHITELLAELIQDGRLPLPRPVERKVTYHDPCYLGRQSEPPLEWKGEYKVTRNCMNYTEPPKEMNRGVNGVYEPPRRILRAIKGLDFVEMHRIREYSYCCGGGGGVPLSFPELARSTALGRLDEAKAVGAEMLVTACSHCRANLAGSQGLPERKTMPVVDIVDLVYEAAGIDGGDARNAARS
jgi:Fe-S oxidoreductase